MNADPNSGYGCTIATDDMRYSNFTGFSFDDRQLLSSFRQVAAPLMPLALQRGVVVLEDGRGACRGLAAGASAGGAPLHTRARLPAAPAQHRPLLSTSPGCCRCPPRTSTAGPTPAPAATPPLAPPCCARAPTPTARAACTSSPCPAPARCAAGPGCARPCAGAAAAAVAGPRPGPGFRWGACACSWSAVHRPPMQWPSMQLQHRSLPSSSPASQLEPPARSAAAPPRPPPHRRSKAPAATCTAPPAAPAPAPPSPSTSSPEPGCPPPRCSSPPRSPSS